MAGSLESVSLHTWFYFSLCVGSGEGKENSASTAWVVSWAARLITNLTMLYCSSQQLEIASDARDPTREKRQTHCQ